MSIIQHNNVFISVKKLRIPSEAIRLHYFDLPQGKHSVCYLRLM